MGLLSCEKTGYQVEILLFQHDSSLGVTHCGQLVFYPVLHILGVRSFVPS